MFPTSYEDVQSRIQEIDPIKYAQTRNYRDGAVSKLSPYISRGVISTKQVFNHILSLELPWAQTEKFVQELAWRDYWQQVWVAKGDTINDDIRHEQQSVISLDVPISIVQASTRINAIDLGIENLYNTGYMHNHKRMYVASLSCNIANCHWLQSAKWMYSHLLDGDWASNALSWQWVAGTNSNKKYFANQENINKYFQSQQQDSYLDVSYEEITSISVPTVLQSHARFSLSTVLPKTENMTIIENRKTLLYNYYNLDPIWSADEDVQRILLLEPSFFNQYPVTQKCINFILRLSENIEGIQVVTCELDDLLKRVHPEHIFYKEHPTNKHYQGNEVGRDWMFDVRGHYPSFFKYWKLCKKEIGQ